MKARGVERMTSFLQQLLCKDGCTLPLAGRVVVLLFRIPPFYTGHWDLFNCLSFFLVEE